MNKRFRATSSGLLSGALEALGGLELGGKIRALPVAGYDFVKDFVEVNGVGKVDMRACAANESRLHELETHTGCSWVIPEGVVIHFHDSTGNHQDRVLLPGTHEMVFTRLAGTAPLRDGRIIGTCTVYVHMAFFPINVTSEEL